MNYWEILIAKEQNTGYQSIFDITIGKNEFITIYK